MNIKKEYKNVLHKIIKLTENVDTKRSDVLLKIIKLTNIKNKFNTVDYWDLFKPNANKCYSILNTSATYENEGEHWISCYQKDNVIYIYDSFARKKIMKPFVDKMNILGYKCVYTNKKSDQGNMQDTCGIRSLIWLLFVEKYGIDKAKLV